MRRLLLSAATLAFLAAPTLAQPDDHHRDGGRDRAQAQPGVPPAQQQRGGNGGPTSFTNQITGSPPGGQGLAPHPQRADQRGPQQAAQPQPAQPQAAPAPQNRGANWQGRDNRNDQGNRGDRRGPQQAAPPQPVQQQAAPTPQNRGGNWQGRDNRTNQANRGNNNFNANRGPGANNRRHDFSSFQDFHRDVRAARHFRAPSYRRPAGWYDHRWTFGEFLPAAFWARDYWLSDFGAYDLPPPPYGAIWVRVGTDALMIDQDSGEVITVEYGVFY